MLLLNIMNNLLNIKKAGLLKLKTLFEEMKMLRRPRGISYVSSTFVCKIDVTSATMATSLSQEDINFLRLAGLLIRVAPRAVRRRFDFEFHPKQLQQFLSKNRHKIDDLTHKKRVITLAQYDLLYPRGTLEVSSDMFDVSLMVCLLRHFTDLEIQDSLPIATIHTVAADISRIKIHRNSIVHSDSGKVQENKFSEIWNCVAEAILRLAPEIKSEIDALISSSLTNVTDILDFIRLEKQLEKTNQHMVAINKKLETYYKEKTYGRSSLHAACFKGHTDVVKLLIGVGLNVNETSNQGTTPLLDACWNGQYDTVKYLFDLNGQTLNSRVDTTITSEKGWSALHLACQNGHCEVVKLLIGAGMNPNVTTNRGSTPLHTACQNGHFEIAKYLIDLNDKLFNSRVDVTTKLKNGCSALHLACQNGHLEIVKLLIDAGMNSNDTIKGGFTPLYNTC
ncbi:unnamed protein product [Mytilus edulis]|uniref:DZIP3-like HEPN domain-containing protein n=1 Tax=Mytilus edulis TaxID=6550 RepID=A0A8S3T3B4_MYTED|nr:unnamed protein product [Mytilus edulis]